MRPAAMDRDELLDRVMNNYRRFYMKKALFHYPWRGTGYRRRYLLGCLKAFMKAGFARTFYDLGKVDYWGPQSKGKLNFNFDRTRHDRAGADGGLAVDPGHRGAEAVRRACRRPASRRRPTRPRPGRGISGCPTARRCGPAATACRRWRVKACGGGDQQMEDVDGHCAGSAAAAQRPHSGRQ